MRREEGIGEERRGDERRGVERIGGERRGKDGFDRAPSPSLLFPMGVGAEVEGGISLKSEFDLAWTSL